MGYKVNRYEYPIRAEGSKGFYTIKEGCERLGFPGERLVDSFVINYIPGNNKKGE